MQKMESSQDDHNLRFMQPLLPGFLHNCSIPVSFLKHLELDMKGDHLQSVVLTTDDQPQRHWLVQVEGGRHFKDGWEQFSTHHGLQVGEFLVFTYKSQLLFQVCVYDPVTACKRISSLSADVEPTPKAKASTKIAVEGNSTCETQLRESHADGGTASPSEQEQCPSFCVNLTCYNVRDSVLYLPVRYLRENGLNSCCDMRIIDDKERPWQVKLDYTKSDRQARGYLRQGFRDFLIANSLKPGDVIYFQLLNNQRWPVLKCTRIIAELDSAFNIKPMEAQAEETKTPSGKGQNRYKSCHVKLTSYSVQRARINLPAHFVRENGLECRTCEVKVIDEKERPWKVKLTSGISVGRARAYLTEGLEDFLAANCLKPEDDVCFQLIKAGRFPVLKCYRNITEVNSAFKIKPKEAQAEVTETPFGKGQSPYPISQQVQSGYRSCHVNLTSNYVKRAIIYLPAHFVREIGLKYRRCEVKVIDEKERPWLMRLHYVKKDGGAYLVEGWKDLLAANCLKPKDAVCFDLIQAGRFPTFKCYRRG